MSKLIRILIIGMITIFMTTSFAQAKVHMIMSVKMALEQLQDEWVPVTVKELRKNKELKPVCESTKNGQILADQKAAKDSFCDECKLNDHNKELGISCHIGYITPCMTTIDNNLHFITYPAIVHSAGSSGYFISQTKSPDPHPPRFHIYSQPT